MAQRRKLIWLAVVILALVGVAARIVLPARAENSAVRDAAQRYVDLIATGDEGDLQTLLAMTVTDSPGALRTAGDALVAAEERIEIIDVGEPGTMASAEIPSEVELDGVVEIPVRFRLAGEEHTMPVVLGKLLDEGGSDIGDWRVVASMTGSIAWPQAGFADVQADAYVSAIRQVRRPAVLGGSDEDVQPLYPAVYETQQRLDPYYASKSATVAITGGEPVTPPEARLDPTRTTQERIRRQVFARFASCRDLGISYRCPAFDLADPSGFGSGLRNDWWLGLRDRPTVTIDHEGVRISGGSFRFRGPDGVRTVRFRGTGTYFIDNQSWRPVLSTIELEETG